MSYLTQSGYIYTQNKGIYVTIFNISRVVEGLFTKKHPFLLEFEIFCLILQHAFLIKEICM